MGNFIRAILTLSFIGICLISTSQNPVKKVNACNVWEQKNPIRYIRNNPKTLLNGKDVCVLSLLDTLGKLYIRKDTMEALICLDSLYKYSDGYVSEYFLEVGEKIFFNQFKKSMKYIYKNRSGSKLKQLIVYSISSRLSDSKDSKNEKKKIDDFMNKEIQKGGFSNAEIGFIQKLKDEFNDQLFN
jgi:hypothetical protein